MNDRLRAITVLCCLGSGLALAQPNTKPSRVEITPEHVLSIDGRKVFTIGFTVPPPPDARAHNGKPALDEFRDAGAIFIRTGPMVAPSGPSSSVSGDASLVKTTAV